MRKTIMEEYRYQKQIDEANEMIAQLKERLRKSLAKRKELALQINESRDIIDQLSEKVDLKKKKKQSQN